MLSSWGWELRWETTQALSEAQTPDQGLLFTRQNGGEKEWRLAECAQNDRTWAWTVTSFLPAVRHIVGKEPDLGN